MAVQPNLPKGKQSYALEWKDVNASGKFSTAYRLQRANQDKNVLNYGALPCADYKKRKNEGGIAG
ncbi:hypothetical protein [Phocaeicola sp. HCN-6420]|uniref:hypothetical protein n=1 Tax=Phocaeicola sp. HCN-6420 TaxID=3134673 RepID=UPI0030EBFB70